MRRKEASAHGLVPLRAVERGGTREDDISQKREVAMTPSCVFDSNNRASIVHSRMLRCSCLRHHLGL